MAVEVFTTEQFEAELPTKKNPDGTKKAVFTDKFSQDGEFCYAYEFGAKKLRLLIRSSVSAKTGISNATGKDSIRIIVQRKKDNGNWYGIAKGPDAYTTRVEGWPKRMRDKIRQVYEIWKKVDQIFTDDENIFVSKKPQSWGRVFATHKATNEFRWLS